MFQKILVPSDGSDYALDAAGFGADLAYKYGAHVTLLYVVELPPTIGLPPSKDHLDDMRYDLVTQGRDALARTRKAFDSAGVNTDEEIGIGSAVPYILRFAHDGAYELIVIGSRGAGTDAIEQILIGSVAEGILHSAPCPVLMIRSHQKP